MRRSTSPTSLGNQVSPILTTSQKIRALRIVDTPFTRIGTWCRCRYLPVAEAVRAKRGGESAARTYKGTSGLEVRDRLWLFGHG